MLFPLGSSILPVSTYKVRSPVTWQHNASLLLKVLSGILWTPSCHCAYELGGSRTCPPPGSCGVSPGVAGDLRPLAGPARISRSFPDPAWLGWHGDGSPCGGWFVVHLTLLCIQCSDCALVDRKGQRKWGGVVRCLRSLPGTLAQGRTARPPAALEFAPCGSWLPKAKVRAHSHKLRAGRTLSEVLLNFGECYLRTFEFFLNELLGQVSSQKTFCPEPPSVVKNKIICNNFGRNQEHSVGVTVILEEAML